MDLAPWQLGGEPTATDVLAGGADLVTMSGDKLLGGPQAGIILGRRAAIAALRAHPLSRAVRVDKLTLAALEATLLLYRDPARATRDIPVLAMLTETAEHVHARAVTAQQQLAAQGVAADVVAAEGGVGGGAFPAARLASAAVRLAGRASAWERALRTPKPVDAAVIGHIVDDAFLLDFRTVLTRDEAALTAAVASASHVARSAILDTPR
jgi:L-seryl-tRNA(Ser) seleniumtransferase